MKQFLSKLFLFSFLTVSMFAFTACSDDDDDNKGTGGDGNNESEKTYYNIFLGVGEGGNDGTLAQAMTDPTQGSVSFSGFGFEVPSTRTAHVFTSNDGKYLYSSNYGGGVVTKYAVNGGQSYSKVAEINVQYAIGTLNPRWAKVSDKNALLHNVVTEHKYKDAEGTEYDYTAATAYLVSINLDDDMNLGAVERTEIPRSEEDVEKNLHVWRIDGPIVQNGKAYYGLAKRGYDPETGKNDSNVEYAVTTIVVDYPSLTNPKLISSGLAKGSNYGYRTTNAYIDEKDDIYQMGGFPSYILRIKNGEYDNSFDFNLSEKLGLDIEVGANGWFYVGNGIGYVPFYDIAKGAGETAASWGVARVDLYNGTAVKMNIPGQLWLQQYQSGAVGEDGKFYMALAPVGLEGNIYMFDPASTSAEGFTLGAKLQGAAGQFYIGIF